MSTGIVGDVGTYELNTAINVPVNGDYATDTSVGEPFKALLDNQAVLNAWFGASGIGVPRAIRRVTSPSALLSLTATDGDAVLYEMYGIPVGIYVYLSAWAYGAKAPYAFKSTASSGYWVLAGAGAACVYTGSSADSTLATTNSSGYVEGGVHGAYTGLNSVRNYDAVPLTLDEFSTVASLILTSSLGLASGRFVNVRADFDAKSDGSGETALAVDGTPVMKGTSAYCESRLYYATSTNGVSYGSDILMDGKASSTVCVVLPLTRQASQPVSLTGRVSVPSSVTHMRISLKCKGDCYIQPAAILADIIQPL